MNTKTIFSIISCDAQVKRATRLLLLITFYVLSNFCVQAQQPRPKWVDDFKGNSGVSQTTSVTVDQQNNIYVTGYFWGTVDFDPSVGVTYLTSVGQTDVFIGKYKQDGTLIWVESIGGIDSEAPYEIVVDKDKSITIVGNYFSLNFDANPGPGVYDLYGDNNTNGFLIHLNSNGGFLWAHSIEGNPTNNDQGNYYTAASDSQDNVITTAEVPANVTIGDSTYNHPTNQIIKYDSSGLVLWSLNIQDPSPTPTSHITATGIAIDRQDNLIISGIFSTGTINFNPLGAASNQTTSDKFSYFVAKYSSAGKLIWVNPISSPEATTESVYPVVSIDSQSNIDFSTIFYPSIIFGSIVINDAGNSFNECIAKYSSSGVLQFAKALGGANNDFSSLFNQNGIARDKNNDIFLAGYFTGSVNFDPNGAMVGNLTSHGPQDFYVAKYDSLGNYIYAISAGSPSCGNTYSYTLAIDTNNNIDIAGSFCSTVNFDPTGCSPTDVTATSSADPFLAQYTPEAPITNDVITAPSINSFCTSGTPSAITGSLSTGGNGTYTYQWQSSADSINFVNINNATGQNYTPPTITATTYYQRIVNSDACSTPAVSNVVALTIATPPAPPVVHEDTTCNGSTATLSVTAPQTGVTYSWYAKATGNTSLFTGVSFTTPILTAPTTYYASATNSTGCSSARSAVNINILPPLTAPVVSLSETSSSSVVFTWAAVPGATSYRASTDGGQTYSPIAGLADTASNLQSGQSVTIIVRAVGVISCQVSTASDAVTGKAIDVVYCPNAFTPNGDGRNDTWTAEGANIQSVKFYIYDQWGELLFSSTSVQNGWDGTYKGTKEPVGVYVYYLEAVMNDGQTVKRKGTITLLK